MPNGFDHRVQWLNHGQGCRSAGRVFRTASLVLIVSCLAQLAAANGPNIVFIMADDLGWGDVEFHDGETPTPHLNALRRGGVELTAHYVAPVCSPTRSGLLTGRYWSRFGITTPINNRGLPFETVTLAKALSATGYTTALIGKWHLGSKPEWGPNHFGFDHSYGSLAGGVTPWSHRYKKGPYTRTWHRNEVLLDEDGHVTDLLCDEAVRWIGEQSEAKNERPFFLYVPFTAVHLPIREPDAWLQCVPDSVTDAVQRQYSACILHLDAAVGRIVEAVDGAGLADSTLIVFTSDNGGSTAENNDRKYPDDGCPDGRLPGNNKPWRGQKGTLYEGGIRVPTVVRWKGRLQPGTTVDTPVCIVDWMPTFCALANAETDSEALQWDGINLWPLLTGKKTLKDRSLHITGPGGKKWALRHGRWKLIASRKSGDQLVTQLYDLDADPREQRDASKKHPEIVADLLQRLEDHRKLDSPPTGGL